MVRPTILTPVGIADDAWGDSGNPIDISGVVISGARRYLAVCVGFNNNDNQSVSSVTIDPGGGSETSLTLIPNTIGVIQDDGQTEMWGVKAPPTGTFTVRVILGQVTRSSETAGACAYPMTDVDQDNPVADADNFGGITSNPSVTLTTTADEMVVGINFTEDSNQNNIDSPGTEDFSDYTGGDGIAAGHQDGEGDGSTTISWTMSGSDKTAASAVSFLGDAGAAAGDIAPILAAQKSKVRNPILTM